MKNIKFRASLPELEQRAEDVLEVACALKLKITTAESCTGGLISSLLTDVEGLSHAFECGYVVYSEASKIQMLGVSPELLQASGAVSRVAAEAMAEGALTASGADVAIAVTGFAGKSDQGEEAGLVHIACQQSGGVKLHRELHLGDIGRSAVRTESAREALLLARQALRS